MFNCGNELRISLVCLIDLKKKKKVRQKKTTSECKQSLLNITSVYTYWVNVSCEDEIYTRHLYVSMWYCIIRNIYKEIYIWLNDISVDF